jgi:hypothetical protein
MKIAVLFFLLAGAAQAADVRHPVVVELFQSQGCSSCPPANANLLAIVDRPDVLALSFGVTYWDRLGWRDTFASKANTDRQWDYVAAQHLDSAYTPQVVVNGRAQGTGISRAEFNQLLRAGDRGDAGPVVTLTARAASIAPGPGRGEVWLVRYDPALVNVPVRAGENHGRTLPHRNVVRQLIHLGDWSGEARRFDLPTAPDPRWKTAILLQKGRGGPILAATRG